MNIVENVRLDHYTTLHVGGVADYMIEVTNIDELKAACVFASQTHKPPLILGGGSNLLIAEEGYRGVVIHISIKGREYTEESADSIAVTVGAGEILDDVISDTVSRGYWGLENLSSIPGTVGATPVQNVGAYGVEVADCIVSVTAFNRETAQERVFQNPECQFTYRDSFFKSEPGRQWVITAVTFKLSKTPQPKLSYADLASLRINSNVSIESVRAKIQTVRAEKFPDWTKVGTAGSFFKNPIISASHYNELVQAYPELPGYTQENGSVKVSLGWILDKVCQLKGYRIDNVGLYDRQALVLVAHKGATTDEVKNFVQEIKDRVFTATQISIECEVQYV